jgi:hypothetical protein
MLREYPEEDPLERIRHNLPIYSLFHMNAGPSEDPFVTDGAVLTLLQRDYMRHSL